MLGEHTSIVIPQTSAYAEERRKWEAEHTQYGKPGRPFVYQEFPKAMYKATRGNAGVTVDWFKVSSDDEQANMASRGYCLTQEEALASEAKAHLEAGKAAAEREWEIQHGRISPKAAAEVRAAEQEYGARHLDVVPETPIRRKPGRPAKAVV